MNNTTHPIFPNSPLTPLGENRKKKKNLSAKNNKEKMTSPLRFDPSGHTTASDPTSQPFYSAVVCDVGLEANVVCNHFFPLNMEAERF